jgi:hypothetical protein
MKLSGPSSISRGYVIHDRLWNYLQAMISRVFWSEDAFMGVDPIPHSDAPSSGSPTTPRIVLRTTGTCEAILLVLEWYPRSLQFPPIDNDTNSIIVRDGPASHITSQGRYGRMRSGVDWLGRSDRMCWSLLELGQSLATELGMFDKETTTTDGHDCGLQDDVQRAHRIK